jgi:hypothetical protein
MEPHWLFIKSQLAFKLHSSGFTITSHVSTGGGGGGGGSSLTTQSLLFLYYMHIIKYKYIQIYTYIIITA